MDNKCKFGFTLAFLGIQAIHPTLPGALLRPLHKDLPKHDIDVYRLCFFILLVLRHVDRTYYSTGCR